MDVAVFWILLRRIPCRVLPDYSLHGTRARELYTYAPVTRVTAVCVPGMTIEYVHTAHTYQS